MIAEPNPVGSSVFFVEADDAACEDSGESSVFAGVSGFLMASFTFFLISPPS